MSEPYYTRPADPRFAELVRDTSNDPHLVAEAERLLGAGRAVQDDGPTEDEEWKAHSAARHVGHVLGLLPSGQLVCDQCEVELGAVQDDGLPTVEALAEAVHRVICPFHRPGPSHMDHGPDHFDDEHATAILTHLRAAPPLHDPSGDER